MECMFQYPIKTELYCEKDIELSYKGIKIVLIFREVDIYTKSKKIRIIAEGITPWDALVQVHKRFHEFFDKIVVFTGESIEIAYFEIVLFNEKGKISRKIYYDLINMPSRSDILKSEYNLGILNEFLGLSMEPMDNQALYYLTRSIQASHAFDKFLNVYHALESLASKSKSYRVCNKCKSLLICPTCKTKDSCSHDPDETCPACEVEFDKCTRFERVTEADIATTLTKINKIEIGLDITASDILKMRHQCAHPGKKGRININKIVETTSKISNHITYYFSEKYNIYISGHGPIKYGTHTGFYESSFNTSDPVAEYSYNVPEMKYFERSNKFEPAKWN